MAEYSGFKLWDFLTSLFQLHLADTTITIILTSKGMELFRQSS